MAPTFEKQLAAVAEVGRRRSRARLLGVLLTLVLGTLVALVLHPVVPFSVSTGWPYLIAVVLFGSVGVPISWIVRRLERKYIDEASQAHGVPRDDLQADMNLSDGVSPSSDESP